MHIILEAILFLILVILALQLLYQKRELKHLYLQLDHIQQGSHIELTALGRDRAFLRLYRKLNLVIIDAYAKEAHTRKAEKRLKQTITDIAHDIRTPLTGAAGYLQLLEDCTTGEQQLRYEYHIQKRLEELKDMLEELFIYTKLTSYDFKLDCQETAIFPVLSECMISMFHVFEEKGLRPEVAFENEDIYLNANSDALGRVFRNLINNALLHGTGNLSVRQEGKSISFTNPLSEASYQELSASGPSILFERFYKSDQSRGKGSSGIGLSIVKELMQQMGGLAEAYLGEGCLTIVLQFSSSPSVTSPSDSVPNTSPANN